MPADLAGGLPQVDQGWNEQAGASSLGASIGVRWYEAHRKGRRREVLDTLAVGTLCEAAGRGVPIAVLPCVAEALAAHPAYQDSVARLRGMGVRFADPYAGEAQVGGERREFGWELALDLLHSP